MDIIINSGYSGVHGKQIDKDEMALRFKSDRQNFSGWISPSGDVFEVETFNHESFLEEKLKPTNKTYLDYGVEGAYDLGFKLGWLRVDYWRDDDFFDLEGMGDGFERNSSLIEYLEQVSGKKAEKTHRHLAKSNSWYKTANNDITLDDLIQKVSLGEEVAGWFNSSDEIYIIPLYDHKRFISMKFRSEIEKLERDLGYGISVYDFAFKRGWVRFYADNQVFSIDCTSDSLNRIYSKIKYIEERLDNKVDIHISKHLETYGFTNNNWYKIALKKIPEEKKMGDGVGEVRINEIGVENHISGWLSSNGTFYKVPVWQHRAFISKVFGNIVKMLSENDLYQFAYLKNWLRIVSYGGGGVFSGTHLDGILEVQGTQEGIYHNKHVIEQIKDVTGNSRIEYKIER